MNKHLKAIAAVATAIAVTGGAALAMNGGSAGQAAAAGSQTPASISTTTVFGPTPATSVGGPTDERGPAGPRVEGTTGTTADAGRVHETFRGPRAPHADGGTADPLGTIDTSGLVPEGLDLTAFPEAPQHGTGGVGHQGPGSLSAGPWCAYQCIESGIAYPRGFGAELVVKTKVPADLWLSVIADYDGDGDYDDFKQYEWTNGKVKSQSWSFDHLEPGQKYYAMVTATDQYGDTSYGYGHFTTLSHRNVEVSFNDVDIDDGPTNIVDTWQYARIGGGEGEDFADYDLGGWIGKNHVSRNTELALAVVRQWDAKVCEGFWTGYLDSFTGDNDDSCVTWNTAFGTIDLDRIPAGQSHWASQSFETTLSTDTGDGDALPPGYGQPRWFSATTVATVHVTYN